MVKERKKEDSLNVRSLLIPSHIPSLSVLQDVKQYYEDYKEMKIKEKEEAEAMAEQEATQSNEKPLDFIIKTI